MELLASALGSARASPLPCIDPHAPLDAAAPPQKREEEKTRGAREAEKMQRIRQRIEQGAAGPSAPPAQLSAAEEEQI